MELLLRQLLSAVGLQTRRPVLAHFQYISTADCLALRQKAYNLLTTPSNILSGCLGPFMAPFMGATTPRQRLECRGWRRRLRCAAKAGLGPDDNPAEMASDVLKPLLKTGPRPGYIFVGT